MFIDFISNKKSSVEVTLIKIALIVIKAFKSKPMNTQQHQLRKHPKCLCSIILHKNCWKTLQTKFSKNCKNI